MDLGKVGAALRDNTVEALQPDGTYSFWCEASIKEVDIFVANYHRSYQRTLLLTPPNLVIPASRIVKIGDVVFILGQRRPELINTTDINDVYLITYAENDSAGLAEITYYDESQANPELGDTGLQAAIKLYASAEYSTKKDSTDTRLISHSEYKICLPLTDISKKFVKSGSEINLLGINYLVMSVYVETGFLYAYAKKVVTQQKTLVHVVDTPSVYDMASGDYVYSKKQYTYPCYLEEEITPEQGRRTLQVAVVYKPAPPFNINQEIRIGSTRYVITNRTVNTQQDVTTLVLEA